MSEYGEEILISKMYTGDYLTYENNIGHEIINLLKSDKAENPEYSEKNFIYINYAGIVPKSHDNKLKYVILVRPFGSLLKVLALVEVDKEHHYSQDYETQLKLSENISYGGCSLREIFSKNTHNNYAIYVTYQSKNIYFPKRSKPLYIKTLPDKDKVSDMELCNEADYIYEPNIKRFRLKRYSAVDEQLKSLIDELKQTNIDDAKKINSHSLVEFADSASFMNIIAKEYDELAVSNMFKYLFSVPEIFNSFASEVLGIENFSKKEPVRREVENIDLFISDDNNVVVIENKIKSNVHGKRHDLNSKNGYVQTQLDEYACLMEYGNKTYDKVLTYITKANEILKDLKDFINKNPILNLYKNNFNEFLCVESFSDFKHSFRFLYNIDNNLIIDENLSKITFENLKDINLDINSKFNKKEYNNKIKSLKDELKKIKCDLKLEVSDLFVENIDKTKHYFIFVPNYNKICRDCENNLEEIETKIKIQSENGTKNVAYKIIRYNKIKEWFNKHKYKIINSGIKYIEEFEHILEMHSKEVDNTYEEDMQKRFIQMIKDVCK